MATIRKHRDKYQVQIRRRGSPSISKTFSLLSDAKEWARHQERLVDRGELGPDLKALEKVTLRQLVTRYRDEVVPTKKGREIETIILNAFLRHPICNKPLSSLGTGDFAHYRDERLKVIAPKSLKRQLAPLHNMFQFAKVEWGLPLRNNPLSALQLKAPDRKRERRLRQGEFQRLVEAAAATRNPLILLVVRFALDTAMRRGEILGLKWKNIDCERETATIEDSKNGHTRVIPLSRSALVVLQEAKALGMDREGPFGLTANALKLGWQRLAKRAELSDLHFHDLRHEAISRLFELGLTVPEVALVSGHRTLGQLMRYSHASQQSIKTKMAASETITTWQSPLEKGQMSI